MKRVVFNQKGGVGKSTITCQSRRSCGLPRPAHAGGRSRPQANSTRYLLGDRADAVENTATEFSTRC